MSCWPIEDGPGLHDRRRRGQLERAEIARRRRRLLHGRLRLTLVLGNPSACEDLRLFRSPAARSIKMTSNPVAGGGFFCDRRLGRAFAFAIAIGQCGWKPQPEGGARLLTTSPVIPSF